jgi:peptidoglycan-associated lipoprotein
MKNFVLFVLLATVLSACAGKQAIKEEPKAVAPMVAPSSSDKNTNLPAPPVVSSTHDNKIEVNPLTDPNNILSKRSIYFDYDKYEVKPEFQALVEAHAKYLMGHPQASLKLEGNADERGSAEYNLSLGQKRAVAVKKVMNVLGVPDKQIETISYGKEKPKALGHDEASWAENRRTDIIYSGE